MSAEASPSLAARPTPAAIASRVAAGLLGGYAFTWGFSTLSITGLTALGVDYDDAGHGAMLLAFLVFLTVFLWAFATARPARLWAVLLGGGALMTGAAWLLQQRLLG